MGKYIKKFDTHSDYEDFIETEDFIKPNVSYCVDNKDVHYNSIQTLFALEIESGRFISFYFQNGKLYANTDNGSSALWVCDGNGVVVDNISYSIGDRAQILEQINEHYGTSFTGWSDNEIGLQLGDTLPDWNAYEKIEMPAQKVALKTQSNPAQYTIGSVKNNIYYMLANSDGKGYLVKENGEVTYNIIGGSNAKTWLINLFAGQGITIDDVVSEIVILNVGSIVPDWSDYTKLG